MKIWRFVLPLLSIAAVAIAIVSSTARRPDPQQRVSVAAEPDGAADAAGSPEAARGATLPPVAGDAPAEPHADGAADRPVGVRMLAGERRAPDGVTSNLVPNTVVEAEVIHALTPAAAQLQGMLHTGWEPQPKRARTRPKLGEDGSGYAPTPFMIEQAGARRERAQRSAAEGTGTVKTFDSLNQDDALGAFPPDPIGAAGPVHVVNVINFNYAFHNKLTGAIEASDFLFNFFAAAQTFTYDPRVVYDPHHDRFVVTTLEFFNQPPLVSRVLVAVSDDSNPNGAWHQAQVNSLLTIGGVQTFADYPSLAVDEQAIYITTNQFGTGGQGFRDARIWAVAKGAGTGGLYDGGAATTKLLDPPDTFGAGANFTLQPADILGTPPPGTTGTFLSAYNALSDAGGNSYLHLFQLNNPVGVGAATLVEDVVFLGTIDAFDYLDAPQPAPADGVDIVGPRIYDAVWQDDVVSVTTVVVPPAGPAGETTAHWIQVDTTNLATTGGVLVDQGDIGGEEIGPNTFTFFPAVAQAADGTLGFGFSGSGSSVYPGSYYTHRESGDPAGTVRPPRLLRRGTGRYEQLDGDRNRWGDYSGIGVDPDPSVGPAGGGQCFWPYNLHSTNTSAIGAGKWGTAWAEFCPALADCGNGAIEPGETCDPPGGSCRSNCTFCGDGAVGLTETCDPPGGDCRADCTACRDGITQPSTEQCDDGNATVGDGCDLDCLVEVCGNGILQFGETCEPPGVPAGQPDECRADCSFCGDGVFQGPTLELAQNGDCEFGTFFGWSTTAAGSGGFSLSTPGTPTPLSGLGTAGNASGGAFYAVSDEIGPGTHALARSFTVPANASAVNLSFRMFVNNWNTTSGTIVDPIGLDHTGPPNQHARVDLLNPGFPPFDTSGAAVIDNLYLGADPVLGGVNPYTTYSFDITADVVPGLSYVLRFAATGNQFFLNLGVDNLSITATIPPPEACDDGNNLDGDGCNAMCEAGCGTGTNFFGQTILAPDRTTLAWALPVDVEFVEGNLALVSSYGFDASGSAAAATSIGWSVDPGPAAGRYKLARIDCPVSTWSSGGSGECPGAVCDRDGSLPP